MPEETDKKKPKSYVCGTLNQFNVILIIKRK